MVDDIYSNVQDEVRLMFTGTESGRVAQLKVAKMTRALRTKLKESVKKQLGVDVTVTEAIYCILHNIYIRPTKQCPGCGGDKATSRFINFTDGYGIHSYCNAKCRANDPSVQSKRESTNVERYGHTNNMLGVEIRANTIANWIIKYDSNNPLGADEIRVKIKATNMLKYGVEHPSQNTEVRAKYKRTMMARHGVDNSLKTGTHKITNLERYGVEFPIQNPAIFAKMSRYRRKVGTWPSGENYNYQGYENVGIDSLLASGLSEDQIIISDTIEIPTIKYLHPIRGKHSSYYPDIFIPHENRLIEIKSAWTMQTKLEENMAKHHASKALGFLHEIWICDAKNVTEIIK